MLNTPKAKSDTDILAARINHPSSGEAQYERVRQDGRTYYRLVGPRTHFGLTDAKHARESIAYWRTKGWLVLACATCSDDHTEDSQCPMAIAEREAVNR